MNGKTQHFDRIIIGGGAAGFFAAIQCASLSPGLTIAILEKANDVLSKVRVSGGGRCNVTHACFDPVELTTFYPRGNKELRGPFKSFACEDTISWFESRGIQLHTETDGRMFPVTNDSSTIINCLISEAKSLNVQIITSVRVESFFSSSEMFVVKTNRGDYTCQKLMLATGSSPAVWKTLADAGHSIVKPVPSLFTFNIQDVRLESLQGISVEEVEVSYISDEKNLLSPQWGPLLITHWGLSGPAVLKLSAWGARVFHEKEYRFDIRINWLYPLTHLEILDSLKAFRQNERSRQKVIGHTPFHEIPLRLWKSLSGRVLKNSPDKNWADLNNKELELLTDALSSSHFKVNGKSTFKDEFVTAGGVLLSEMDLKKFESKIIPGLYIAGEALDIDAVTGGFNFQAAWTGGFLAGTAMASDE